MISDFPMMESLDTVLAMWFGTMRLKRVARLALACRPGSRKGQGVRRTPYLPLEKYCVARDGRCERITLYD